MAYLIISIFVFVFLLIRSMKAGFSLTKSDYAFSIFLGIVLGVVVGYLVWFVLGGLLGLVIPCQDKTEVIKITALSDSNSITRKSYVNISTDYKYRYMIETEKGKLVQTLDLDRVYINEGKYEPRIVKHKSFYDNVWLYAIAIPNFTYDYNYAEIYVPKGSIINSYNIDLE